MRTPSVNALLNRLVKRKRPGWFNRRGLIMQKFGRLTDSLPSLRVQGRKIHSFKPVAASLLALLGLAIGGIVLSRTAWVRPNLPRTAAVQTVPSPRPDATSAPAVALHPTPAGVGASDRNDEEARAAGVQFAERLFRRGALVSELNRQVWAKSYPSVYRRVQANPEYGVRFVDAARTRESELVRVTLGDPPLVVDGADSPVLSAQVSGPVGRAIKQGLREPGSYRHDAQDHSRPRPYYHQNRWCWKVDRFWYRSRNTFGRDVKDCVAPVVAKDDPYHEYKVLTLEQATF